MKNGLRYALLLFVLIFGLGQIIKFAHEADRNNTIPKESVLYSDKTGDHPRSVYNDASTIPAQFSNTVKSQTFPFRIHPLSKYLFHDGQNKDANFHVRRKFILYCQHFVLAEKHGRGYYVYALRKIII